MTPNAIALMADYNRWMNQRMYEAACALPEAEVTRDRGAFFGSILYAVIGVVVLLASFIVVDKLTPYNLWEEIVEKQNMALAVVVAGMALGVSFIIAAAVHG